MSQSPRQLVVCYISGLDLRRVKPDSTKFLAAQLQAAAWRSYENLPSNELFPTLVTGVNPAEHGVWGVKINENLADAMKSRPVDRVPDSLTTLIQCGKHFITGNCDLSAIPPRRRRKFEITRTKYKRRNKKPEALFKIGTKPTVLGIVGQSKADYTFSSDENPQKSVIKTLCREHLDLEILELYSLDRYQQWNLHDEARVASAYQIVDEFLEALAEKCARTGKSLMVVSDHGHEAILQSFNLDDYLDPLNLTESDYSKFIEVSSARFWFHSERARTEIPAALQDVPGAELVSYEQMSNYGVPLTDPAYGELFCYLPPGSIFFPHDFYQPLANLFFGLTDPMQRSRLSDPRHRGNHGHLPHHVAEKSFVLIASDKFKCCDDEPADILDIAPSILSSLELPIPDYMPGRTLFERA